MPSEDTNEKCVMHSDSDNIETRIYEQTNEVIRELFELLLYRYQIGLKISIKGSDFTTDSVNLLHCKCHKVILNHGGSFVDSSDLIKKQKETKRHKKPNISQQIFIGYKPMTQ